MAYQVIGIGNAVMDVISPTDDDRLAALDRLAGADADGRAQAFVEAARACLPGPARDAATSEATPKYAPLPAIELL